MFLEMEFAFGGGDALEKCVLFSLFSGFASTPPQSSTAFGNISVALIIFEG